MSQARKVTPRVHLPVTYFLFRDTTFHLAIVNSLPLHIR